jgi:glycine cleavage system H protein
MYNNFYRIHNKFFLSLYYQIINGEKMNIPENLKYTKEHEWVKVENNVGTIGITDYAQKELGDIIYLDVTADGEVSQGDSIGTIEAVKTVSDLYSPVSGKIVEVNKAINDDAATVNKDPYGAGWMVKIELSKPEELNELLSVDAYKELTGTA